MSFINTNYQESFEHRHNGSHHAKLHALLQAIGVESLDQLIEQTIPSAIRLPHPLNLPVAQSEQVFLKTFRQLAQKNKIFKSYIGTGYSDTFTPTVILRNILENPAWYTAYTPYQAEIAQGRLEALLNFQTVIIDLTGMEITNASLLDEATAAAEAMTLLYNTRSASKKSAHTFFVSELCHPQTIDVLLTRGAPLGMVIEIGNHATADLTRSDIFGLMVQYPATDGSVIDYTPIIATAHALHIKTVVAADLLSLTLLTPPGEMGADVVVGSAQRFGVPMGYGGPHAGFFATKDEYKRQMAGRIIGVSVDAHGNRALRMALQTREQHIRREKATSNICTAQVLLSVMASSYAVYHGPDGLRAIAERIYGLVELLSKCLQSLEIEVRNTSHFDTIQVTVSNADALKIISEDAQMNFRYFKNNVVGISLDETSSMADVQAIVAVFAKLLHTTFSAENLAQQITWNLPENLTRKTKYLTHEVFNTYHTEHEMLRYLKSLESKDLSLVHSMISLGSCTMKLNATTEMIPVTWQEFGGIHPFAPANQAAGYQELFDNLNSYLCEITGFAKMSFQPNSGAQGEYAGLMVIRAYHQANNASHRNVVLIPSSAHGTNPASAALAGMKIVIVNCDSNGNIDITDLRIKAQANADNLSSFMVTYPSTHGVFEEGIREICQTIHQHGGQVYMDGANMNAQVGLTSPAMIGADVCHLNLHKTFCIPHGGGGPGMGPIGVAKHLVPYLPSHVSLPNNSKECGAVSAAPFGSASILPISYAYIAMMGGEGLTNATKMAILNANYIKTRLEEYFPVLYTGSNGRCAHEMILDCRPFKQSAGIEVEDIAKRLMDYGFHAPTVSFPVAGTLMIEPTESESKEELDRFCDAMIAIRGEITEIENNLAPRENNVLKNAPHTAKIALADDWIYPYSRQKAVYPLPFVQANKFWATVSRIDGAYGDRNLVCSCLPIEEYISRN